MAAHDHKPIYTSMKKLYLFLVTAIVALCGSFAAEAATGGTISWNYPGAVEIYTWTSSTKTLTEVSLDANATSYTVEKNMIAHYVFVKNGYQVASFSGIKPNGDSQSINKGNPFGYEGDKFGQLYNVTFNGSNAGTNFILELVSDEEANKEATFTLDIENGSNLVSSITVGTRDISYADGKQTVSYKPALEKDVTITVASNESIYSAKHNGVELPVKNSYGTKYYKVDAISADDIITIRGYEEAPVIETCKVTIDIPENAKDALNKVWNTSTLKEVIAAEDGSYTVNKGDIINIRFNEDYQINSVKANDADVTVNGLITSNFTINADTHVVIDAAPIAYADVTWTVYIANPEGVSLRAGNGLVGYDLDLSQGGEPVTSDIEFKAAKENGVVLSPAMTIPAAQTYKFTFTVSEKYSSLLYNPKEGYWIKATRNSNLSSVADNPVTDRTFYIVAQKIDRSAKAVVYLSTNGVKAILNGQGTNITIDQLGYKIIEFDPEYDTPFSGRFYSNAVQNPAVYVDGTAAKADENNIYSLDIKDGSVVKMFGDGKIHSQKEVSVDAAPGTSAEITYDKIVTTTKSFSCFDGTEVTIVPGENTSIVIDGNPVQASRMSKVAASEGTPYTFTTTGAHQISLVYTGAPVDEYILDPVSGSTVESLDPITIAFPNAADVTVEMAGDEILFMSMDQTYAAWNMAVTKVEDADCPTFQLVASPAPDALKQYMLNIPAGFFKINGATNSPEIDATFTLQKKLEDIEVMFSPTGDVPVSEYPTFNIVFEETLQVSTAADIASKLTVTFDGETLTPETDFMYGTEGFYFMLMLSNSDYFRPGALTVSLAEGALSLSGTPSPAIAHTWNLIEPKEYVCTITPDATQTVTSLEKITVVFENAESATISNSYGVSLKGGTPGNADYYNVTGKITPVENEEHPTFDITFDPAPTNAGQYELTLGYGVFYLDNSTSYPNGYLTRKYTLSPSTGIEGVIVDGEANGDIYNLQGVKLNSKWSDLPAGLYIIGGQKVIKH